RRCSAAGNWAAGCLNSIAIDSTPPLNTTPAVAPGTVPSFSETITGSDATSGIAGYKWTVDGGPDQTGSAVTITADGTHTLNTWVVDAAGNESLVNTDTV